MSARAEQREWSLPCPAILQPLGRARRKVLELEPVLHCPLESRAGVKDNRAPGKAVLTQHQQAREGGRYPQRPQGGQGISPPLCPRSRLGRNTSCEPLPVFPLPGRCTLSWPRDLLALLFIHPAGKRTLESASVKRS